MKDLTSESLIGKTNELLDSIHNFNPSNIQVIEELVETMKNMGFANPFKPIIVPLKDVEVSADTKKDIKRQIKKMKEIYLLKKYTLRRAKVAYAAHRLCNHFKNTNYFNELIHYLPYDGSYVKRIATYNIYAYECYLTLMQFLSTSVEEYSVLVTLKYRNEKDNEVIESFKLINPNNINERVKAIYGNSAEIIGTKFLNPLKTLIKGAEYRIALATALTSHSVEQNLEFIDRAIKNTSDKFKKYDELMKKNKLNSLYRIDLVNGYEEVKEELVNSNLAFYDGEEFFLDNELAKEIEHTKNRISKHLFEYSRNMIQRYLITHMISNINFNFLPNFTIQNKELYAELFDEFIHDNKNYSLKEAIKEFVELEKYNVLENDRLLAALLAKHIKDVNIASQIIGISKNEVQKSLEILDKVDFERLKKFND
ncbi:MAG: DUF530 domain-containing protein [Candidatus Micrarchaeota archaeon]|nr:DUF530 domain-containing protein [Candidatus Micrarchaeota archaeon]